MMLMMVVMMMLMMVMLMVMMIILRLSWRSHNLFCNNQHLLSTMVDTGQMGNLSLIMIKMTMMMMMMKKSYSSS